MNILVSFFTKTGNCRHVANQIQKLLKTQHKIKQFQIIPKKHYNILNFKIIIKEDKFYSFNFAPKSHYHLIRGKKPEINKLDFNPKDFDVIILCTPVWIGNIPAPVHTFIDLVLKNSSKTQKFIILLTSGQVKKEFEAPFYKKFFDNGFNKMCLIHFHEKFFEEQHEKMLLEYVNEK